MGVVVLLRAMILLRDTTKKRGGGDRGKRKERVTRCFFLRRVVLRVVRCSLSIGSSRFFFVVVVSE